MTPGEIRAAVEAAIEDVIESGEGDTFVFDGVQIKIKDPVSKENGSTKVNFKITANDELQSEVEDALNAANIDVDGPVGPGNPSIKFDDNTPDSPSKITDDFRLMITASGNYDLIDV